MPRVILSGSQGGMGGRGLKIRPGSHLFLTILNELAVSLEKLPSRSRPQDDRRKFSLQPALHHLQCMYASSICGTRMYCSCDMHHECILLLMHTCTHTHTVLTRNRMQNI